MIGPLVVAAAAIATGATPSLIIQGASCDAVQGATVERVLRLESDLTGVSSLSVSCLADAALLVASWDAGGTSERDVSLRDVSPESTPRLIALALAELVARGPVPPPPPAKLETPSVVDTPPSVVAEEKPEHEADDEDEVDDEQAYVEEPSEDEPVATSEGEGVPDPSAEPAEPATVVAPPEDGRQWVWFLGGATRRFESAPFTAGASASLGVPINAWLQQDLALRFDRALRSTSSGTLELQCVSAGLVPHLRWTSDRLIFALGAGVHGGWVALRGKASQENVTPGELSGAWLGVGAEASVELMLGDAIGLRLGVEGGHVVTPVVGLVDDRPAMGVWGPWFGMVSGVTWHLR